MWTVSYPRDRELDEAARIIVTLCDKHDLAVMQLNAAREALEWQREDADRWRNAHASVVVQKRTLGAKYGAIMARKPGARWRRTKKRVRRWIRQLL